MSRVGKKPITIDSSVKVEIAKGSKYGNQTVKVVGPKGTLELELRKGVNVAQADNSIVLTVENETKQNKALHGLYRAMINNMVDGVKNGYSKVLEIHGVGFRSRLKGQDIEFDLGFTHPVLFKAPQGITFTVQDDVNVTVTGIDKQLVGETAAKIRRIKQPEPYKGKGIRYQGEYVRRKQGKTASK
jgi:large subunit ribosomal protein L6